MPSPRSVRRPQRLGEEALAQVNGGLSGWQWPRPQPTGTPKQFTLTTFTYQQGTATYT